MTWRSAAAARPVGCTTSTGPSVGRPFLAAALAVSPFAPRSVGSAPVARPLGRRGRLTSPQLLPAVGVEHRVELDVEHRPAPAPSAPSLDTCAAVAAALHLADSDERETALRGILAAERAAARELQAAGRRLVDCSGCSVRPAAAVFLYTRARYGEAAARRALGALGMDAAAEPSSHDRGPVPLAAVLRAVLAELRGACEAALVAAAPDPL